MNILGPTNKFPKGKIQDDDKGELKLAIGADIQKNVVFINFGTPCTWLALPKKEAVQMAHAILKNSEKIQ